MKHLVDLPRRNGVLRIIAALIVIVLAGIFMAVNAGHFARAQTVTYWWGTDYDWTIYRNSKPNGSATLKIPQDFYIAYLGHGLQGESLDQTQDLKKRKAELDRVSPAPTIFAYWTIRGPGDSHYSCSGVEVIAPDDSEATLKQFGADQAMAFLAARSKYSSILTFSDETLFADIERQNLAPTATGCDWWGHWQDNLMMNAPLQYWRSQKVLEGFLEALPMDQRGVYSGQTWSGNQKMGLWPDIMTADYQFPASLGNIVIWLAKNPGTSEFDPGSTVFQQQTVTQFAESVGIFTSDNYTMGGLHPTLWQFYGDKGSLALQDPSQSFILPRGFYPQGIHVTYYNDIPPAQYTLGGPINWNTFTTYANAGDVQAIDFTWGTTSPAPGVNGTFWSAIYSGTLLVPYSGSYTFYLDNLDDGGRIFISDTLVLESWLVQGPHYYSATISLQAGQVPIRIEYAQGPAYEGSISVYWRSDSFAKELIKSAAPPAPTPTPTPTPCGHKHCPS